MRETCWQPNSTVGIQLSDQVDVEQVFDDG